MGPIVSLAPMFNRAPSGVLAKEDEMSSKMKGPAPGNGHEARARDRFGDPVTEKSSTASPSAQSMWQPVPMPRSSLCRRYRLEPISWAKVEHWIERYNRFVELWNQHELDHGLPLSPEWENASITCPIGSGFSTNTLLFTDRVTQRLHAIHMNRWEPWKRGTNAFIRNKANVQKVMWAGVEEPEGSLDD